MYCAIKMSELKLQLKNNHEFCLLLCTAQFNLTQESFTLGIASESYCMVSVKLSKFNSSSPDSNFAIHHRIPSIRALSICCSPASSSYITTVLELLLTHRNGLF
jgi:hypothetical protein